MTPFSRKPGWLSLIAGRNQLDNNAELYAILYLQYVLQAQSLWEQLSKCLNKSLPAPYR